MQQMTPTQAIRMIEQTRTPIDIFGATSTSPDVVRRARRRYRSLIALVHPDLAPVNAVAAGQAERASAKLGMFFSAWQRPDAEARVSSAPHVVGVTGEFELAQCIRCCEAVSAYATDRERVFVEISRTQHPATDRTLQATRALERAGLAAFGPRVIDHGVTTGHAWVAYELPEGLVGLGDVRYAVPGGLDGRDWAWMARRIVMTLDAAGVPHGRLGLDTVLIHPEQHGVVLVGWGGSPRGARADAYLRDDADLRAGVASRPADRWRADRWVADLAAVAELFDRMLAGPRLAGPVLAGGERARCSDARRSEARRPEARQREFAAASTDLEPRRWLAEYDLLLSALYGRRRYRPFSIPRAA